MFNDYYIVYVPFTKACFKYRLFGGFSYHHCCDCHEHTTTTTSSTTRYIGPSTTSTTTTYIGPPTTTTTTTRYVGPSTTTTTSTTIYVGSSTTSTTSSTTTTTTTTVHPINYLGLMYLCPSCTEDATYEISASSIDNIQIGKFYKSNQFNAIFLIYAISPTTGAAFTVYPTPYDLCFQACLNTTTTTSTTTYVGPSTTTTTTTYVGPSTTSTTTSTTTTIYIGPSTTSTTSTTTTSTSSTTTTTTTLPYMNFFGTMFSCPDCTEGEIFQVSFPAGTNVILNKFYKDFALGVDFFVYEVSPSTVQGEMLDTVPYDNCTLSCNGTSTTTTTVYIGSSTSTTTTSTTQSTTTTTTTTLFIPSCTWSSLGRTLPQLTYDYSTGISSHSYVHLGTSSGRVFVVMSTSSPLDFTIAVKYGGSIIGSISLSPFVGYFDYTYNSLYGDVVEFYIDTVSTLSTNYAVTVNVKCPAINYSATVFPCSTCVGGSTANVSLPSSLTPVIGNFYRSLSFNTNSYRLNSISLSTSAGIILDVNTGLSSCVPDCALTTSTTTTTTTTILPFLPDCVVLLNASSGNIYYLDPVFYTTGMLGHIQGSQDIAMTNTRLWVYDATTIYEYAITLAPWSGPTFLRNISYVSSGTLAGLSAIDNNTLVVGGDPDIIRLDITTSTAVPTVLFSLPTGGTVIGDIYYNSVDNLYIILYGIGVNSYISQFDTYGNVQFTHTLPALNWFSIYSYGANLYGIVAEGDVYIFDNITGAPTLFSNVNLSPQQINGATQQPSCNNFKFNAYVGPSTSTTTTSTSSTTTTTTTVYVGPSTTTTTTSSSTTTTTTTIYVGPTTTTTTTFPYVGSSTTTTTTTYVGSSTTTTTTTIFQTFSFSFYGKASCDTTDYVEYVYSIDNGPWITFAIGYGTTSYTFIDSLDSIPQGSHLKIGVVYGLSNINIDFGIGNGGAYTGYFGISVPYDIPSVTAGGNVFINLNTEVAGSSCVFISTTTTTTTVGYQVNYEYNADSCFLSCETYYSDFISTWRTTAPSQSITLPYEATGTYFGVIDWGDGTTSANNYANRTHTYSTAGDYVITIKGIKEGWKFNGSASASKILSVQQWGSLKISNTGFAFAGCNNLTLIGVNDTLKLSGITSLEGLFINCTSLTTINNMNSWDTSSITTMKRLVYNCLTFNQNISNWNTSSVTDMSEMFTTGSCGLGPSMSFNQDISGWDVSKVTNMSSMLRCCSSFNYNIGLWNTSSVTNMNSMLQNTYAFTYDISDWIISNVTSFVNFMAGKTYLDYSTSNLDAIYNKWSLRPVQPNINISFGTIKRTAASTSAKAILTGSPNLWTITDGGI